MLIIVEANEQSGKTSIIDELRKRHPEWLVCKRTSHKTQTSEFGFPAWDLHESSKYDWRFFLEMLMYSPDNLKQHTFICDRSFITDYVFNVANWPELLTEDYLQIWHALNKQLQQIPHVVLFCKRELKDPEHFKDTFGGWTFPKWFYDKVQDAYACWRSITKLNVLDVDNDTFDIATNCDMIENFLNAANHAFKCVERYNDVVKAAEQHLRQ